jgi:radical SAM superfamily enzyme YgiQ (UPF0313 family)
MAPRVYIVQVCNVFGDAVYLPLAAGMLRAQARAVLGDAFQLEPIIHERFDLAETGARIVDPSVLALSTYVWSWEYSLELARRVRALHPEVTIVIGGPQVPDDCSALVAEGLIDVAVHGEGEVTFVELLRALRDGSSLGEVAGISWRGGKTSPRARVEDLDTLASPFLGGDFESLLAGKRRLIGLWETNRGCPFGCTFCYWGSAVNTRVREFAIERLERELDWFVDHRIDYVLCADANFGIRKRDIEIARKVRDAKARTGHPRKFRVFSTKNATERVLEVVEVLREGELDQGLSLTMQTLSPTALEAIGRKNIKLSTYVELGREARKRGLVSYSDLIVGLPGETYDSFVEGLDQLLEVGQHDNVHVYFCTLLVGSQMADPEYRRAHGVITARNRILERHMRADAIDDAGVHEYEDVVIGTATMPVDAWIETNLATAWFNLLHFMKLANFVAIYLRHAHGVRYRRTYEMVKERARGPVLSSVTAFVTDYYRSISEGCARRLVLEDFGDVVWPMEEAAFLHVSRDFDGAYAELQEIVRELVEAEKLSIDEALLADLFAFQMAQMPRHDGPPRETIQLAYDWPAWFDAVLAGESPKLERRRAVYRVINHHPVGTRADYARSVAWYARSAANIPYKLVREDRRARVALPLVESG